MNKTMNSVYIRYANQQDAKTLAKWWASGNIMEHAGFPKGIQTDIGVLEQRLEKQNINNIIWIIDDQHHQPIGEMSHQIKDGVATIGIKICVLKAQKQGIGKIALKRLISFLFEKAKVEKITLDTMIENKRAQHVYQALKFSQAKVIKNAWKDQLGRDKTAVVFELDVKTYQRERNFYQMREDAYYANQDI